MDDNDIEPETFAVGCFLGVVASIILILLVVEAVHLGLSIW